MIYLITFYLLLFNHFLIYLSFTHFFILVKIQCSLQLRAQDSRDKTPRNRREKSMTKLGLELLG